jgi:hypothetical protein
MNIAANDAHAVGPPESVLEFIRDMLEQLEVLAMKEGESGLAGRIAEAAALARRIEAERG